MRLLEEGLKMRRSRYPIALLKAFDKAYLFRSPRAASDVELTHWIPRTDANIGILLKDSKLPDGSGLVAFDADDDDGYAWCKEHGMTDTPMIQITRRGFHFLMRHRIEHPSNRIRFKKMGLDVLFNTALICAPSVVRKKDGSLWQYKWVNERITPATDLPLLNARLLIEPKPPIIPIIATTRTALANYIAKIEIPGSGSAAEGACFRCACRIASQVEDIREGLSIFFSWNADRGNPLTEPQARHKIEDAYKRVRNQTR